MTLRIQLPLESQEALKKITSPTFLDHLELGVARTAYDQNNPTHIRLDDDYYQIKQAGDPIVMDGPPIYYRINRDGFRSQHFGELDRNKVNILFGGCSWTFGEAQPEEYTWTSLLSQKMDTLFVDKKVSSYNTGYMGSSIPQIVKNLIGFSKKYGNPDYIFVCLPDIPRAIYWSDYHEGYTKQFPNIQLFRIKMDPTQVEYTKSYIHENNWMYAADYMRYLEDYCEFNGIKLLWNTWHAEELQVWDSLGFKNFFNTPGLNDTWRPTFWDQSMPFPHENHKQLPYWEIGRDNAHPGTCWSVNQSEFYFNEVLKKWF